MEVWQLYLLTRIDTVRDVFEVISFFGWAYFIILGVTWVIYEAVMKNDPYVSERARENLESLLGKMHSKLWLGIVIASSLAHILIPTRNELVFIYLTNKITTNEQIMDIPEKVLELANLKLGDLIEEQVD